LSPKEVGCVDGDILFLPSNKISFHFDHILMFFTFFSDKT
jgi:hypothetical protein